MNKKNDFDKIRFPLPRDSRMGEKRAAESHFATLNVRGGMDVNMDKVCEVTDDRNIDVLCVSGTK